VRAEQRRALEIGEERLTAVVDRVGPRGVELERREALLDVLERALGGQVRIGRVRPPFADDVAKACGTR